MRANRGSSAPYGSYEALLADDDVEAVYVSLPNALHVPWSIKALEAGKHVLCEKPLGRTPEAVERAFDTADRQGRLLMEAFMYRHHPQTQKLKELVGSGAVGELRQIRTAFTFTLDLSGGRALAPGAGGRLTPRSRLLLRQCQPPAGAANRSGSTAGRGWRRRGSTSASPARWSSPTRSRPSSTAHSTSRPRATSRRSVRQGRRASSSPSGARIRTST